MNFKVQSQYSYMSYLAKNLADAIIAIYHSNVNLVSCFRKIKSGQCISKERKYDAENVYIIKCDCN